MSKGEARPFLRKDEKTAIKTDAHDAKRLGVREIGRVPLNADQQRALGQMSITDGVPIIREAPEGYTSWPQGMSGLARIERERRPPLIDVIRASQGLDETDTQPAFRPGTRDDWNEEERIYADTGQLPTWMSDNGAVASMVEHRSMQ